jgi:hypothetical protein
MEADDLLCSRNARSKKTLVGRAQWKINQPPSLEKITSERGRIMQKTWEDHAIMDLVLRGSQYETSGAKPHFFFQSR